MNRILLILLSIISISTFGQDIAREWKRFYCKNWTCEINTDTSQYLGRSTQGHIIFHCNNDPSLEVKYFVFKENDINESFRKKIFEWLNRQSCLQIINGDKYFRSFTKTNYYYLLEPCPKCSTYNNVYCRKLNRKLNKFISADLRKRQHN